jgi:chromosome segregation protein
VRQVIEQLEAEMRTRFDATFGAVAEAFSDFFPRLFGGGEAALVLAETEGDAPAGIEVVARPPGKRRQPLALLSGGERALTAVALVFGLLKVSGTPFVVLDEVDAALDEANVDRFCAALRELATTTQVVIVTHNRGTIQAAGTVYGISMGDDGASQVISLQVESAA